MLDLTGDEDAESLDVAPGADYGEDDDDRRRSDSLAAAELAARRRRRSPASSDAKLQGGAQARQASSSSDGLQPDRLLPLHPDRRVRGAAPARRARQATSRWWRSPGTLAAGRARGARRSSSASARAAGARRTDCLSEGINLQEHFDAVVHYDLVLEPDAARAARGPRRPLRPARADRCAWSPTTARTRRSTGSCSTCCCASTSGSATRSASPSRCRPTRRRSIDAILEGLLTRGRDGEAAFEQLSLDVGDVAKPISDELDAEWESAAEREKRSHTMFAQQAIKADEVHRELARDPRRDRRRRRRPPLRRPRRCARTARPSRERTRGGLVANLDEVPAGAARRGRPERRRRLQRFELVARRRRLTSSGPTRSSQALAAHVLDTALDPLRERAGRRALRGDPHPRGHAPHDPAARPDPLPPRRSRRGDRRRGSCSPRTPACSRSPGAAGSREWLDDERGRGAARRRAGRERRPRAGRPRRSQRVVDGLPELAPRARASSRASAPTSCSTPTAASARAHARAAPSRVEPQLPPDVLGVYVLLPAGERVSGAMRLRSRDLFQTVRTEGGLLPADLLQRVADGDSDARRPQARPTTTSRPASG